MSRIYFVRSLVLLVLTLATYPLLAVNSATYAVGSCKPNLPSFSTITAALAATPAATVIMVCPGTYPEQVVITRAVTLQGVASGNSNQAIIAVPSGGLVANATLNSGDPVAAQLWANNAGSVNINNLTFDAVGHGLSFFPPYIVGIFYQNTAGTVNRVATRNQTGNLFGVGLWAEGGFTTPSLTVENSSFHDFDLRAMVAENNTTDSELTLIAKGNVIDGGGVNPDVGIVMGGGATTTVSNNLITRTNTGIFAVSGAAGSISNNTVTNNFLGIHVSADGVSATTNNIFASSSTGILLGSAVAMIQGNGITGSGIGIDFACLANPNVHSNSLTDVSTALIDVPASVATTNTYMNVGTIRTGGC